MGPLNSECKSRPISEMRSGNVSKQRLGYIFHHRNEVGLHFPLTPAFSLLSSASGDCAAWKPLLRVAPSAKAQMLPEHLLRPQRCWVGRQAGPLYLQHRLAGHLGRLTFPWDHEGGSGSFFCFKAIIENSVPCASFKSRQRPTRWLTCSLSWGQSPDLGCTLLQAEAFLCQHLWYLGRIRAPFGCKKQPGLQQH